MFDNRLYLKSVSHVSLVNTIDAMFSYIKRHSKVPIHKRFNMSKEGFSDFKKRLYSRDIHISDFSRFIAVYQSVQVDILMDKFNQYNEV